MLDSIRPGGTVLITGAGSGIGRALAMEASANGMNVVLLGRRKDRVEVVADAIRDQGLRAMAIACDVGDRHDVDHAADVATSEFGNIDLLCLNAGTSTAGLLLDHAIEDWDWVYRVVLMGVVHGIKAFVPAMVETGTGHVMITGSQAGIVPDGYLNHGPYTSAKAAVTALSMTLRGELAGTGVDVSLLVPGATATDFADTSAVGRPAGSGRASADLTEITQRDGLPDGIEGAAVFLQPAEVAKRAFAGLRQNLPIIATHPGQRPIVAEYVGRIVEAYSAE